MEVSKASLGTRSTNPGVDLSAARRPGCLRDFVGRSSLYCAQHLSDLHCKTSLARCSGVNRERWSINIKALYRCKRLQVLRLYFCNAAVQQRSRRRRKSRRGSRARCGKRKIRWIITRWRASSFLRSLVVSGTVSRPHTTVGRKHESNKEIRAATDASLLDNCGRSCAHLLPGASKPRRKGSLLVRVERHLAAFAPLS